MRRARELGCSAQRVWEGLQEALGPWLDAGPVPDVLHVLERVAALVAAARRPAPVARALREGVVPVEVDHGPLHPLLRAEVLHPPGGDQRVEAAVGARDERAAVLVEGRLDHVDVEADPPLGQRRLAEDVCRRREPAEDLLVFDKKGVLPNSVHVGWLVHEGEASYSLDQRFIQAFHPLNHLLCNQTPSLGQTYVLCPNLCLLGPEHWLQGVDAVVRSVRLPARVVVDIKKKLQAEVVGYVEHHNQKVAWDGDLRHFFHIVGVWYNH
mmetsp:Transcript_8253/g.22373  ORF Transcript_8253/g.22373 Transcript_8253/m.22373 type:complete len:267 (-) Transcript_8253:361-1161(-)